MPSSSPQQSPIVAIVAAALSGLIGWVASQFRDHFKAVRAVPAEMKRIEIDQQKFNETTSIELIQEMRSMAAGAREDAEMAHKDAERARLDREHVAKLLAETKRENDELRRENVALKDRIDALERRIVEYETRLKAAGDV